MIYRKGHFDLIDSLVLDEIPMYYPLVPFDGPVSNKETNITLEDLEKLIEEQPRAGETEDFKFESISDYYHKYR